MKKAKRSSVWFFVIVFVLIGVLVYSAFFGIFNYYGDIKTTYVKGADDIRWGIDISGGVEAIFTPDIEDETVSEENMTSARSIIETRMVNQNITDYEVYTDNANHQIIVRFPWQSDEKDYDPKAAVEELGEMAVLTFREGSAADGQVILTGKTDVEKAEAGYTSESNQYIVQLKLTESGKTKFAEATERLLKQTISIWMDDVQLSAPTVNDVIRDGNAQISGNFDAESATKLANQINAGSLPFALRCDDSKLQIISPTLGKDALRVMLVAGIAAFIIICLFMILRYRLPGLVAAISLIGHVGGMIACISGFFPGTNSFTLTIPGIAGIILSIGMGVDANVITAERVKDEFDNGKTIDGAILAGNEHSFTAILDGNITVVIVSLVLMGAFGTPGSLMATIFSPIMSFFSSSVTGAIYSFGYTLLIGVVFNFVMGVFASRTMLRGLSRVKFLRKPWLFGGKKNA